jgi:cytosine/adenosine deaminase-related metal-dependent hydrolase
MQDEVGSLSVGKRADVVVHRTDRPVPMTDDPVPNLVYYNQSSSVDTVIVDGEVIFAGGQYTRFDADAAIKRINEAARALEKRIHIRGGTWPIKH